MWSSGADGLKEIQKHSRLSGTKTLFFVVSGIRTLLNLIARFLVSSLSQQSASPHGGFFAVASDYFKTIEFIYGSDVLQ